jgi:uncharacterized protein involved in response to NO
VLALLRFMVNKFRFGVFLDKTKAKFMTFRTTKRLASMLIRVLLLRFVSFINKRRLSRQKFYQFRKDSGSVRG